MPEQQSGKTLPATDAAFEAPFQTALWPFGTGGLNLTTAGDAVPVGSYADLTNVAHEQGRELRSRLGQAAVATGGTIHHTIRRVADPEAGTVTRAWGIDGDLYLGYDGALTLIDSGYSTEPLTLVPYRPPLSGDPWIFVADRSRMRKVRFDGLVLPIGLPAPGAAPALSLGTEQTTPIADILFEAVDGTARQNWTPNAGTDYAEPPNATDVPTMGAAGDYAFITDPSVANLESGTGWYSYWNLAHALDLSQVGTVDASDDDLIHLWLKFSHPWNTAEVRIYFVCSAGFSTTILPGTDPLGAENTDFYVKAFRPDDFVGFVQATQAQITAAETSRIHHLRDDDARDRKIVDGRLDIEPITAASDPDRKRSKDSGTGVSEFIQYGIIGRPLRRGDFQRVGSTTGRDWGTITGLVVYLQTLPITTSAPAVDLYDLYLRGGRGLDSAEPGAQKYDYRYTHYDPRTGAESNPSPEQSEASRLDSLRRRIVVDPAGGADGALRQRIYRRGGSLIADWYFVGENAGNGVAFNDDLSDDAIVAAGTVALDHYQPVSTVDDAGATVNAQPVPVLFGPYDGLLLALGDPHRPGHVYWCIPDEPDHWPPTFNHEVTAPSEPLLAGVMFGGQPYVFTADRLYVLYPSLTGTVDVRSTPTGCTRGLAGRWAWTVGPGGIYFVAKDGIYRTTGGEAELLAGDIRPIFRGEARGTYQPIDFTAETVLRLTTHQNELWFLYQDTLGARQVLVYHLLTQTWRHVSFGQPVRCVVSEEGVEPASLLLGGQTGTTYQHAGTSDDGLPITAIVRTGDWDLGEGRKEKLLGDQSLDVDLQGVGGTLQNFLNHGAVTNPPEALVAAVGRQHLIFDGFGLEPQKARTIATEIRWSTTGGRPVLYVLGTAISMQPELTVNRPTVWDDFGHPDESYVTGVTLDCDTGGSDRLIYAERDWNGVISTIATFTVNCDGRHKRKFSWPALPAHQVRIRPDEWCRPWLLYRTDWIHLPEPPRIAKWDIHFEATGDQYYTGLDLYCDTGGQPKTIVVEVDGTVLSDPATGDPFWTIQTFGRRWVHLTLPWGRGHVFHFTATDGNPGLLYSHKWYLDEEPSEQHNWNQNFSVWGSRADKWLKNLALECDTYGQDKTVTLEADGAVVETLTVNTTGRSVVQFAFPQHLGRVWRIFPTDHQPGRLYSAQPTFDEEPFQLTRWETQETDFDLPGFSTLIEAQITLKSTRDVTLTVTHYPSQRATVLPRSPVESAPYVIQGTDGIKDKRYVPFLARKGVLWKFVLTSPAAFWLYQEESSVLVQPWGRTEPLVVHPFGNEGADRAREMTISTLAAARSGGASSP